MKTQQIQLNIALNFNQVIDIVKQLSFSEKQQLSEVIFAEQEVSEASIPEGHKKIVRERIKQLEESKGSYLSWNEIEHKMATRK